MAIGDHYQCGDLQDMVPFVCQESKLCCQTLCRPQVKKRFSRLESEIVFIHASSTAYLIFFVQHQQEFGDQVWHWWGQHVRVLGLGWRQVVLFNLLELSTLGWLSGTACGPPLVWLLPCTSGTTTSSNCCLVPTGWTTTSALPPWNPIFLSSLPFLASGNYYCSNWKSFEAFSSRYGNFFGAETHALLPYDQYLHRSI